ncbi:uncharacterized protein GIQ15_06463 [Arthroderma uncinatum]|uniref:uncharacterized protein n=1 Tax=Arthroderma uncinatum TaxID=74035 RepID=UPI00144ABD22|nr:uncharacterized protein GIQ15_06463 [Arthroderma uncinatum]KAF3479487.1 hypothetical protein GIQ15_06463 [Arthroderma uncinatum]
MPPTKWYWSTPEATENATERFMGDKDLFTKLMILIRGTTTTAEFLPCHYVCKRWSNIAFNLLYSVVCLTGDNFFKFLSADIGERRRGPLPTKALTLSGTASWPNKHFPTGLTPVPLDKRIRQLARLVGRYMLSLETFSLHIDDSNMHYPHRKEPRSRDDTWPAFDVSSIQHLLRKIPPSCKNIELDTSGYEITGEKMHLCSFIAPRISELEHVRLRLRQLCMEFILVLPPGSRIPKVVAPELLSLVISCEVDFEAKTSTAPCPCDTMVKHVDVKQPLRNHMHNLQSFPKIQRLEVYERVSHPAAGADSTSKPRTYEQHPEIRDAIEHAWRFTECGVRLPEAPGANLIELAGNLAGHTLRLNWRMPPKWLPADVGDRWVEYAADLTATAEGFELVSREEDQADPATPGEDFEMVL